MAVFLFTRAGLFLGLFLCAMPECLATLLVGSGPTFSYSYSPRTRLNLDTNASNVGVYFGHEPTVMNCSYIATISTANPATGVVTYVLLSEPGYVIQHVTLSQKGSLFSNGRITGEYSTDRGITFKAFFMTPPYAGDVSYTDAAVLRNLMVTNLIVRYTIRRTSGFNYNVQFLRDCDDASFALAMEGTVLPQAEADRWRTIIPQGSVWKYLDHGSNQGTAWRLPTFTDDAWPSGPAELGYGDGDEATTNSFGSNSANKYITTYYRHAFELTHPASFDAFTLGLVRDDGAVVYLNGAEIFRSNLPGGTVLYTTRATNAEGGLDEAIFRDAVVPIDRFRTGTNYLAVEVHQSQPESSDISFNLDLTGRLLRPWLSIVRAANCVVLSWDDPNFILEEANDVAGPWHRFPVNPISPFPVCDNLPQLFYRLSNP